MRPQHLFGTAGPRAGLLCVAAENHRAKPAMPPKLKAPLCTSEGTPSRAVFGRSEVRSQKSKEIIAFPDPMRGRPCSDRPISTTMITGLRGLCQAAKRAFGGVSWESFGGRFGRFLQSMISLFRTRAPRQRPRQPISVVQELFQVAQGCLHLIRRRRDELGLVQGTTSRADPILAVAEVARLTLGPANSLQEPGVDFPQEPQ